MTLGSVHEKTLNGMSTLREHLLTERRDDFCESLIRRMLTYALGRRLELNDQEAVDALMSDFEDKDYRLRSLIQSIVVCEPFLTK